MLRFDFFFVLSCLVSYCIALYCRYCLVSFNNTIQIQLHHYHRQQQILVSAPSNAAVDEVLVRILKGFPKEKMPNILRIGDVSLSPEAVCFQFFFCFIFFFVCFILTLKKKQKQKKQKQKQNRSKRSLWMLNSQNTKNKIPSSKNPKKKKCSSPSFPFLQTPPLTPFPPSSLSPGDTSKPSTLSTLN